MKAILIARVSTEEQKEAGLSLPAQIARLERYCQSKGFEIIHTFSFDESAYTDNRAEFDQIVNLVFAQQEKVAVCCDKVDRLSRNMFDKRVSLLYERALADKIELHFVSDGQVINSRISAVEKFQFGISLGLAKYYSDAISDNVKRANEQKLRKGEWTGRAPYGYKNIRLPNDKKDIVIDEVAAPIIKQAFELYASGAYSMELLCKKILDEYGLKWSKGYLDAAFNNPFYHGVMLTKGTAYPHRYPPLISKNTFDQVQLVKSRFKRQPYKFAGLPYLYRGLIRCAECGLAITPEKHKGHVYYHCTQFNGKHGAQWIREEDITEQLADIFKRIQIPKVHLDKITKTLNETHVQKVEFHTKHFDELTTKRKVQVNRLDKIYLDRLDGKITEESYSRYYEQFRNELADIDAQLTRLQEAEDSYYETATSILKITMDAHNVFISSEVEDKRHLIKLVLSNLKLEGKTLVYEAHKPFDLILECSDRQLWCARQDSNLWPTV